MKPRERKIIIPTNIVNAEKNVVNRIIAEVAGASLFISLAIT